LGIGVKGVHLLESWSELRLGVRRPLSAAWLLFCLAWYVDRTFLSHVAGLSAFSDFSFYYRAGQAILSGQTPYIDPAFMYPPILGFLSAPLALTDYLTARWIWLLLSHACLAGSAWLVWSRGAVPAWIIAPVWAFGGAASESLALGQAGSMLTLALTLTYLSPRCRGAAAGFGFALKYIPGVSLLWFVWNREWRTLAAFTATAALLMAIPWAALALAFTGPLSTTSSDYLMGTPALLSWSVPATLLRTLDFPQTGDALPHDWEFGNVTTNLHLSSGSRWAATGLSAALLLLGSALFLFAVTRRKLTDTPILLAGLISLGLAASPVSWSHYQMLQYPGVALLLASAWRSRQWKIVCGGVACFALCYPIPVEFLYQHYIASGGWGKASAATVYCWTSIPPLASLGLFGLFLVQAMTTSNSPTTLTPAE